MNQKDTNDKNLGNPTQGQDKSTGSTDTNRPDDGTDTASGNV